MPTPQRRRFGPSDFTRPWEWWRCTSKRLRGKSHRPSPIALARLESVASTVSEIVEEAYAILLDALRTTPETFGITSFAARELLAASGSARRFREPEISLYEGGLLLVRFAEGDLECCDPHGIAVSMHADGTRAVVNMEHDEEE